MVAFFIHRRIAALTVAAVALLFTVLDTAAANAGEPAAPSFFASRELRLTDLRRFEKWRTVLARSASERRTATASPCHGDTSLACRYAEWQAFLDGLRGKDRRQQLDAVNRFMNARPYRSDERNWGAADHWATPGEFMTRSGDCEDYVIAKYLSLRELGWTDADLRLVAVKDQTRGIGHAVLVAFLDGRSWLLDNLNDSVTATEAVGHYRPVYSINETAWWLHRADSA
jgi:predicted transglutaminase-like cysteine proteinase